MISLLFLYFGLMILLISIFLCGLVRLMVVRFLRFILIVLFIVRFSGRLIMVGIIRLLFKNILFFVYEILFFLVSFWYIFKKLKFDFDVLGVDCLSWL